jgi:hypothetical protein
MAGSSSSCASASTTCRGAEQRRHRPEVVDRSSHTPLVAMLAAPTGQRSVTSCSGGSARLSAPEAGPSSSMPASNAFSSRFLRDSTQPGES